MKIVNISSALFVVLVILTGCVSKNTKELVSTYAEVSNKTQKSVLDTYTNVIENMNKEQYYMAIEDDNKYKRLDIKEFDYSGQKQILSDLKLFTETLVILTGDSFNKDIDKNSEKLYKSAKKLSENELLNQDISEKDLQNLSIAINGAMRGYTEYIRHKKLKEIMSISDKWVQVAIDSLDNDLRRWKSLLNIHLNNQKTTLIKVFNNPKIYCNKKHNKDSTKKCTPLTVTFQSKYSMHNEIISLENRIDNLDKEFNLLKISLKTLSRLHAEVIMSLEDKKIDKKLLKNKFRDLKEQVSAIGKFRKKIKG